MLVNRAGVTQAAFRRLLARVESWTSMFVAMAMSRGGLITAAAISTPRERKSRAGAGIPLRRAMRVDPWSVLRYE